jgi:hypothetical protein
MAKTKRRFEEKDERVGLRRKKWTIGVFVLENYNLAPQTISYFIDNSLNYHFDFGLQTIITFEKDLFWRNMLIIPLVSFSN